MDAYIYTNIYLYLYICIYMDACNIYIYHMDAYNIYLPGPWPYPLYCVQGGYNGTGCTRWPDPRAAGAANGRRPGPCLCSHIPRTR